MGGQDTSLSPYTGSFILAWLHPYLGSAELCPSPKASGVRIVPIVGKSIHFRDPLAQHPKFSALATLAKGEWQGTTFLSAGYSQ